MKYEGYSYSFSAKAFECESSVSFVHDKPTPDCLEQKVKHDAVKERDAEFLNKNWIEDVQLPAQLKDHGTDSLEMLAQL